MSLEEIDGLQWEQVENYYKCYYNEKMSDEMQKLAIAGIEYNKPDKIGTPIYKDYMDERKKENIEVSLRDELLKKLGIKEVIKAPIPLIHNSKKKTKRRNLVK